MSVNIWGSSIPVEIAKGGTNAIAMATANGIIKYDGTRLIPSTTATINATNCMTNTAQPAFMATAGGALGVIGNAPVDYLLGSASIMIVTYDQGGNFFIGDGAGTPAFFTAPVTGKYLFNMMIQISGIVAATEGNIVLVTTGGAFVGQSGNVLNMQGTGAGLRLVMSQLVAMNATDTASFQVGVAGEAGNVVNVTQSTISGCLIC